MRSYQVNVTLHSPITLRYADRPDDREAMFRFLTDVLTDVSLDVGEYARARLEQARRVADEAGVILDIPELNEPMGVSRGFTDVTGHIGRQWR